MLTIQYIFGLLFLALIFSLNVQFAAMTGAVIAHKVSSCHLLTNDFTQSDVG